MDLVVADNRTVPYIYLLNIIVAEEDLKLMKYVSKHDYLFVPKIWNFEDKTRRKPKITGGGGRAGDARKDGSQPPFYWVSRVDDLSMSRTNRTEEVRRLYRVNVRPLLNCMIHPELELCSELDQ